MKYTRGFESPKANIVKEKALCGDLVLSVSPATCGSSEAAITAAIAGDDQKFTRNVQVKLVTASNELHSWFNDTLGIAATKTGSGTAAIEDSATTVSLVDGVGTVTMEYTGTWDSGAMQTETIEVINECTTAGDITVAVTATTLLGDDSGASVTVALLTTDDTVTKVAEKIVAEINGDETLSAVFTASNAEGVITLTANEKAANDASLSIAVTPGDTGVTVGSSNNGTAGDVPDTATLTVTGGTILGYSVTNKTSVDTLID